MMDAFSIRLGARWTWILLLVFVTACGTSPEPEPPPPDAGPPAAPTEPPPVAEPEPTPPALAQGQRAGLRSLTLKFQSAILFPDRLTLMVVFENTSEDSFGLAGELGAGEFRLIEDGGEELEPLDFDHGLRRIDGGAGLAPGELNGGRVSFPRPVGNVFTLQVPGFAPLEFTWEHIREDSEGGGGIVDPGQEPDDLEAPDPGELPLVRHSPPSGGSGTEFDNLLAEQAAALATYDLERYVATFTADRRGEERQVFLRSRPLGLETVEMRLTGPPSRGDGTARGQAELSFGFDGLPDDNRFFHALDVIFERDDSSWRVASLAETAGARLVPWRHGELAVHRSHHFLIVTAPEMQAELVELAADAEAAYASLYRRRLPLAPGYAIYFVPTLAEFQRIAGHPQALGVALARYTRDGNVDSRAFYVNGPLFTGSEGAVFPAEARRETVTHELVHLALAAASRPTTPPWLKEGTAVYFSDELSFDANRQLVHRGLEHLDLERMTRYPLGHHDTVGRQTAAEYLFAGNTVSWLVDEHGQDAFLDFYRDFATPLGVSASAAVAALARPTALGSFASNPRGTLALQLTETALTRHFGLGLAELESSVKDRLRVQHG